MSDHLNDDSAAAADAADELGGDAKHGARRRAKNAVRDAVADAAHAVEQTVTPFRERLLAGAKSLADDPARLLGQVRGVVRDYPMASLATVAVASIVLARALRR